LSRLSCEDKPSVLVLGARGVLGTALVRAFGDAGWRVVAGTRRGNQAGGTVVDLDWPETVTAATAGVDLVVDPVPHPTLTAERAVLRDGGALIDVSMRSAAATRRLRAEAADPQGAVALNAGRIPGISNLVVYELLAAHPDADAIEIVFSFTAGAGAGRAAGESLHRLLTSDRRRSTAVIPFPAPMWIAVRRHGTLLDARTITGHGNYRVTAAATLVLAQALLDPMRSDRVHPGCFEPQELFSVSELKENLRQAGVAVNLLP